VPQCDHGSRLRLGYGPQCDHGSRYGWVVVKSVDAVSVTLGFSLTVCECGCCYGCRVVKGSGSQRAGSSVKRHRRSWRQCKRARATIVVELQVLHGCCHVVDSGAQGRRVEAGAARVWWMRRGERE
jgi:hypothetical protein